MPEGTRVEEIGSVPENDELRGVIVNAMSLEEGEENEGVEAKTEQTEEIPTEDEASTEGIAGESEGEGEEKEELESAEAEGTGESTGIEAPEHWAVEDREMFSKQTPEAKDWLMDIYKGMESAHTKRSQEIAPFRNTVDQWSGYLNNVGVRPEQMFNSLMQVESALRTGTVEQKRGTVLKIAQEYGISLNIESELEDDNNNPERDMLIAENHQLRQNTQMAQQNDSTSQVRDAISQFKSEMDIHGKPKHPYFDELESDMAQLAQVDIASGKVPDLSELYEKAMWSNSTVRSKLLQSQQTETKKNQEQERQAKLAKAKKAGSSISGSVPSQKTTAPKSIEEDVRALYDAY